jgi:hypothetical protein
LLRDLGEFFINYESMWWLLEMVGHYTVEWRFHDNEATHGNGLNLSFEGLLIIKKTEKTMK